ncbi:hypothetical protein GCM10022262_22210 [Georgenia daeguensis]|uniref:Uncharacterized protein n=1 Tax=Georgenia daeguensis TaxID=908355 RepID=A0ABP8EV55_9MICO
MRLRLTKHDGSSFGPALWNCHSYEHVQVFYLSDTCNTRHRGLDGGRQRYLNRHSATAASGRKRLGPTSTGSFSYASATRLARCSPWVGVPAEDAREVAARPLPQLPAGI